MNRAILGAGGVIASALESRKKNRMGSSDNDEVPHDMTGTSLFGGGLIAGDALAALGLGLIALGALVT